MSRFTDDVVLALVGKLSDEDLRLVRDTVEIVSKDYSVERITTAVVPFEYRLPDCYLMYMASKSIDGKMKKTSAKTYRVYLEDMLQTLRKPVEDITTNDLRAYIARRSVNQHTGKPLAKTTVNTMKTCFSSFFTWLEEEEYIEKNPMKKIHRERVYKKKESEISDIEIAILRQDHDSKRAFRHKGSEARDRAMIDFMLSSGVRVTELCRLKVSDIDMDKRTALVFGKGDKYRTVYFDAQALISIKAYLAERSGESEYLFCSLKEPHSQLLPGAVRKVLKNVEEDTGVKNIHPHRFRRTFATRGVRSGMDVEIMQIALGHSKIDTTLGYVNSSQDQVAEAYRRIYG